MLTSNKFEYTELEHARNIEKYTLVFWVNYDSIVHILNKTGRKLLLINPKNPLKGKSRTGRYRYRNGFRHVRLC